eukprot:PhM_4_TR15962/c0_g1_i1/m.45749
MMRSTRYRLCEYSRMAQSMGAAQASSASPQHQTSGRAGNFNSSHLPYDPFGGMPHRDYYRDPSQGHVPQYAPRNTLQGGAIEHHHATTPQGGFTSAPTRSYNVAHIQQEARRMREMSRAGQQPGTAPQLSDRTYGSMEHWLSSQSARGGQNAGVASSWDRDMDPAVAAHNSGLGSHISDAIRSKRDNYDRSQLYLTHGFHEHDKHEADRITRYQNTPFTGYDAERSQAAKDGRFFTQANLPNVVPPSSHNEATRNVESGLFDPALARKRDLLHQSQSDQPMFGEDLTRHMMRGMEDFDAEQEVRYEKERASEFGEGRQGPLVQEGGPDQRTTQMHKNDDRVTKYNNYLRDAYADRLTFAGIYDYGKSRQNPYDQRKLPLVIPRTTYDYSRRIRRMTEDKSDVYDRHHVYLGQPVKSQIDDKVRSRKGARGERPLEYFMPFVSDRNMRLNQIYRDVDGMWQLSRGRASTETWGLFLRFREHWYQRRQLALRHNLEPRVNETASERDDRRRKLDQLCAQTPFVDPGRTDIEIPDVHELRSWFGVHIFPTLGGKVEGEDTTTESLLTIQHINSLFLHKNFADFHRQQVDETFLKPMPLKPRFEKSAEDIKRMSADERRRYDEYIDMEIQEHKKKWETISAQRKYIHQFRCYAVASGLEQANNNISVMLEDGSKVDITKDQWLEAPLEITPDDPNLHRNWGLPAYPYNFMNYVETQDFLWEQRTYSGEEGWSPAVASDKMVRGMIVKARRCLHAGCLGDWEKAEVVQYITEPYYNPAGHERVAVRFLGDDTEASVAVKDVLIWQVTWSFPDRTIPDETKKYSAGMRRYIDMRDPTGSLRRGVRSHFLDKFIPKTTRHPFESIRQITELDVWARWDQLRPDNYRRLTINDRKDYLTGSYMHRITPWDMILHQEDDQPLMFFDEHYLRDDVGPSWYINRNRFWVNKRRPAAYLKNYTEEIRDFFSFVDAKVPWSKAKLVSPIWNVRKHNPFAQYHSAPLAAHRNNVGMLPTSTWEVDRKSGKITTLKDDLSEYVATTADAVQWGV